MNNEICFKYLNFMIEEVDRHLSDGELNDDELAQFSIELKNFKERVESSNLDNYLKDQIKGFNIDYTASELKRSTWNMIIRSLSYRYRSADYTRQRQELIDIKEKARSLANFMLLNYQ